MKNLLMVFLLFGVIHSCSSQEKNQKIIGNTYKAQVGNVYVETTVPDPCAGETIYLYLKFNKNNVEVNEQSVSGCKKINHENKYTSEWTSKGDTVHVKKLTRYSEPIVIKELILKGDSLVGNAMDHNGEDIGEFIFIKEN